MNKTVCLKFQSAGLREMFIVLLYTEQYWKQILGERDEITIQSCNTFTGFWTQIPLVSVKNSQILQ